MTLGYTYILAYIFKDQSNWTYLFNNPKIVVGKTSYISNLYKFEQKITQ